MQRITITIPRQYNDGKDVPESEFQQIEQDIIALFGGYSRIEIAGVWTDESGESMYENSFRYEILVDEPYAYDYLRAYARNIRQDLGQFSILCTCESVRVDFIS